MISSASEAEHSLEMGASSHSRKKIVKKVHKISFYDQINIIIKFLSNIFLCQLFFYYFSTHTTQILVKTQALAPIQFTNLMSVGI